MTKPSLDNADLLKVLTKPAVELFVISFASLYLELLVIRWMSGDIEAFSIFKTFPLVTCYIGLGLGCALGRDRHFRLLSLTLPILALGIKLPDLLNIWNAVCFPTTSGFGGFKDTGPAIWAVQSVWIYMLFFMPFLILVLSGPFALMAAVGARIGILFNELKPLTAYAVNIGGAIIGSVAFSIFSFFGLFPWQLLIVPCLALYPYIARQSKLCAWSWLPLLSGILIAAWSPAHGEVSTITYPPDKTFSHIPAAQTWSFWSPYQRLDVVAQQFVSEVDGKTIVVPLGMDIFANRRGYQQAMDLSPSLYEKYNSPALKLFLREYRRRYHFPFELKPQPSQTLIVGAGSGTDVKEALNSGTEHIDAVDIDPIIIKIGKELNAGRPYQDPRVSVICDDARHFFNHCNKRYDLIVFSHLDSHSGIGQGASVRVDNYVYTVQSFRTAFQLLKPNGLMVISFCTSKDWFRDRLYETAKAAIGYPPLVINDRRSTWLLPNTFLVAGKAVQDNSLQIPAAETSAFFVAKDFKPVEKRVLTDDWPYLYATPDTFDVPYLAVLLEVVLLALFAGRKLIFGPSNWQDWQLFFMGGAFLLLELQGISRLSLLYGSSWLTSAVVINAVLLMILAANFLVIKAKEQLIGHKAALYVLLLCTLLISYFSPTDLVMKLDVATFNAGYALLTLITVLPMFVAGLIFSASFEGTSNSRRALAFNLLGAVLGALLEYLSNYVGINNLILIASGLYLLSFGCLKRYQQQSMP